MMEQKQLPFCGDSDMQSLNERLCTAKKMLEDHGYTNISQSSGLKSGSLRRTIKIGIYKIPLEISIDNKLNCCYITLQLVKRSDEVYSAPVNVKIAEINSRHYVGVLVYDEGSVSLRHSFVIGESLDRNELEHYFNMLYSIAQECVGELQRLTSGGFTSEEKDEIFNSCNQFADRQGGNRIGE